MSFRVALPYKDGLRAGVVTISNTTPESLAYYAFEQNCGIGLQTARVISNNRTLLIFAGGNVIDWEITNTSFNKEYKFTTLHQTFDPETVYSCGGTVPGLNTNSENIDFDLKARTLKINNWGEEIVVNF